MKALIDWGLFACVVLMWMIVLALEAEITYGF